MNGLEKVRGSIAANADCIRICWKTSSAGDKMARLKYYLNEANMYGENGKIKLTNIETRYIFQRLKKHYKLRHNLEIWGTGNRGNCSKFRIKVSYDSDLSVLVHEVAHGIQYEKNYRDITFILGKKRMKWHTKKHMRIMARIYKYMMPRLEDWRAMANKKSRMHTDSVRKKEEKAKKFEEFRKTPKAKLEQVERRIKLWESKRQRAEKALKKLARRKMLWERKLNPCP